MKFNSSGIIVDYIKGLLRDTHIPVLKFYRGQPLEKDKLYIKGDKIYRAVTKGQALELTPVMDYDFGREYKGLTNNYQSKESYWSKADHYYLWKYLIMIREFYGKDYLYMFNCWNGGSLNSADGIKYITIPVEINQTYTLFVDCDVAVHMEQGGYSEAFGSMSVNKPITIKTKNEKDLLIQLPSYVNRVKVVEGDYSSYSKIYYGDKWNETEQGGWTPNKTIQVQVGMNEAFDNRLIQYLANNVIGTRQVESSIKQAQAKLGLSPTGIWSNEQYIQRHYAKKGFHTQHGEIDKDMENV